MRAFQFSCLLWTFFISLFVLVLHHVTFDLWGYWIYMLFVAPFVLIKQVGGQGFPKYAALRFFGSLAREELLEPLVEDARKRWAAGERRADLDDERVVTAIRDMYEMVLDIEGKEEQEEGQHKST